MSEKKSKNILVRRIIAIAVIALLVMVFYKPSLLFFLSSHQQKAIQYFTENYIKAFQPLKDAEGGFDFLRIGGLVLMFAECWLINAVIQFLLGLVKL